MRDGHGQDLPVAGAAGGAPADRGGGGRAGDGLGPGECASYLLDEDGLVWRLRWPCDADDKWCAVDGMGHLDALAGRCPGGDDAGAGVRRDTADRGSDVSDGDADAAALLHAAGEGGRPLRLRGGVRADVDADGFRADVDAAGDDRAGPDWGTIDLGDWPSLI
jgi:hypothetical protein